MIEDSKFIGDGSGIISAPCNKCAFTHHRRKRERDLYRGGSEHPRCAWHIGGVPISILKRKNECKRYVEKIDTSNA